MGANYLPGNFFNLYDFKEVCGSCDGRSSEWNTEYSYSLNSWPISIYRLPLLDGEERILLPSDTVTLGQNLVPHDL